MSDARHILIVDDERDLVELLTLNLQKSGYRTTVARTGRSALEAAATARPDLILLDVMLPELSGTEVASRLRTSPTTSGIPILMLTAKTEEVDQLVGLAVGADDYVTKPFSMKVLMARVEALLRRAGKAPDSGQTLRLGPVEIDMSTHEVRVDDQPVKFTLTEFRLLASLLQAAGRVMNRNTLMSRAMGPGVTVTERTIDVHMTSIRKKLGPHSGMIRTVRGVGYRVIAEPASEPPETADLA
ncbi:MAG: response regulator transcription factor [Phycisphaeraceae bacterium]|nr:MAG: response regulator transcription factor [Phycisphaeraceae bacterium]